MVRRLRVRPTVRLERVHSHRQILHIYIYIYKTTCSFQAKSTPLLGLLLHSQLQQLLCTYILERQHVHGLCIYRLVIQNI